MRQFQKEGGGKKMKHVITESIENLLVNLIIQYAQQNQLTAANISEAAKKVENYMKDNAVLEKVTDHADKEIEVVLATTDENKHIMMVGNEKIEISDYKVQSSADGAAEFCVTIKGSPQIFELHQPIQKN